MRNTNNKRSIGVLIDILHKLTNIVMLGEMSDADVVRKEIDEAEEEFEVETAEEAFAEVRAEVEFEHAIVDLLDRLVELNKVMVKKAKKNNAG